MSKPFDTPKIYIQLEYLDAHDNRIYADGIPYSHPGCLSHVTHPCEECGRIAGRSTNANVDRFFDALTLAKRVHANQVDKGGQPYIFHPFRVATVFLTSLDLSILGLLHDVIEDAPLSADDGAGLQSEILAALHGRRDLYDDLITLTRRKGEAYEDYIARVRAGSMRAWMVKIADLRDNLNPDRLDALRSIQGPEKERKLRDRYTRALKTLADI